LALRDFYGVSVVFFVTPCTVALYNIYKGIGLAVLFLNFIFKVGTKKRPAFITGRFLPYNEFKSFMLLCRRVFRRLREEAPTTLRYQGTTEWFGGGRCQRFPEVSSQVHS
jgi:hypothetical protein